MNHNQIGEAHRADMSAGGVRRGNRGSAVVSPSRFHCIGGFGRAFALFASALIALLALMGSKPAHAFDPNADLPVWGLAVQPDGGILVAGQFSTIDGQPRSRFARLLPDGSVDLSYHVPTVSGFVWAVAAQPDGKALVGGKGSLGNGGLLRINADGTLDTGFVDAVSSGSARIEAIAVQPDGKILIGGLFSTIGNQPRTNLARLNADGTLDAGFDAGNVAINGVSGIAVQPDGRIIIGGYEALFRLEADGAPDNAWPLPPITGGAIVNEIAVEPDGQIVIAGESLNFGDGTNYGPIVRLNGDGSYDADFMPAVDGSIQSLLLDPAGKLVIGGGFGFVDGQPRPGLARLNSNGTLDTGFDTHQGTIQAAAIAMQSDSKLIIGGPFTSINGLARGRLARLHPDGRVDNGATGPLTVTPLASAGGSISPSGSQQVDEGDRAEFTLVPDVGFAIGTVGGCGDGVRTGNVYTTGWIWADCTVTASFVPEDQLIFDPQPNASIEDMDIQDDGRILVAGWFTRIGGLDKIKVARLDPVSGEADPDFVDGTGIYQATTGGDVGEVVVEQADGKVLFGGQQGLLRINADGTMDTGFAPPLGPDATVDSIVVQPDGKILIGGGNFGLSRSGFARLNADGSVDSGFVTDYDRASEIVLEPDGKIMVVGIYPDISETSEFFARINADGSLDSSYPSFIGSGVTQLHRLDDGRYLAGGFTLIDLVDGSPVDSHLIRLLPNGFRDPTYETIVDGGYGGVHSITAQPDGSILIGGGFANVNGSERRHLARLDANGVLDADFDVAVDGWVLDSAVQSDGKIVIVGRFNEVEGYPRTGIARLKADGGIDIDAFLVTPLAGANGTITPNTPQEVNPGESIQFTIVPDPGYVIGAVQGCNGQLDGLTYATGPIASHCTITVDFLLDNVAYTVTPIAGANGAIEPGTPQSVLFAQTASFELTPDAGHYLADVEGCDGSLSGTTYTTERVLADCVVIARFHQPDALAAIGGTPQATAVNTAFALPLAVRVTDEDGVAVAGVEVAFSAPTSPASAMLSSATAVTDGNGEASISARANDNAGSYLVTASAHGIETAFALSNEAPDQGSIEFRVTVSTDPPPACGTGTAIEAVAGEAINYCFTVINRSDVTLNYHTLTMLTYMPFLYDYYGWDRVFNLLEEPIPPGGMFRYNHVVNAGTDDQAPMFTWNATATEPGYEKGSDPGISFSDISATGTPVPVTAYGTYKLESLPFAISYYGQRFRAGEDSFLCINNSGGLYLRPADEPDGCPVPSLSAPPLVGDNLPLAGVASQGYYSNGLAVHWDLLGDHGAVYYAIVGEAPNRRLIVQWQDKDHFDFPNPGSGVAFQAVIEEGTNRIHYVYEDLSFDVVADPNPDAGGSATVGLLGYVHDPDPLFVEHSYNSPALTEGQVITWTPTDVLRHASASVMIEVGTPQLMLAPDAVHAVVGAGGQAQSTLTIGNAGEIDLTWSLEEAATQAHFPPTGAHAHLPSVEEMEHAGTRAVPPSPNMSDIPVTPEDAFVVPAYANATNHWLLGAYFGAIAFDASHPEHVAPGTGIPYVRGEGVYAADLAGNDLNRAYLFGYVRASGGDSSDFSLAWADTATGETTWIGHAYTEAWDQPPFPRWDALAWDNSTGTLFAAATSMDGSTGVRCMTAVASELYSIDTETAAATRIGAIQGDVDLCIRGLAVAPDGAMYGIDSHNNAVVAIDKTTGEAAVIGWLGFNIEGSISADFDEATGTLYLANGSVMYTVDTVTGLAALVAQMPSLEGEPVRVEGLSIAVAGGDCTDPAQVSWLSVGQTAGVTPAGGQSQVTVDLDAGNLAPGTYEAQLCIFSNDRRRSLVRVPVAFDVTDNDRLFVNGFESAP